MSINFNHVTNDISASSGNVTIGGAAAGGGSWVYLSTVTASASATVDIETTFDSTYDNYVIVGSGIFGSNNEVVLARLKIGGAYLTAGYDAAVMEKAASSGALSYNDSVNLAAVARILIVNTDANGRSGININIFDANSSALKALSFDASYTAATNSTRLWGSIGNRTAGALTGVRIYGTAGTLTGTFRLYGIKNS